MPFPIGRMFHNYPTPPPPEILPQKPLPDDFNKTVGWLNGKIIDAGSFAKAGTSTFFRSIFSIPKGFFSSKVDPKAQEKSDSWKISAYNQASGTTLGKKDKLPNDAAEKVGGFSLLIIGAAARTLAFGQELAEQTRDNFRGFIPRVTTKFRKSSDDTKRRIYYNLKNQQLPQEERRNPHLYSQKKPEIINIKDESTTKSKYKRSALMIAILGAVILLAYYVYPLFNIEDQPEMFPGQETDTWDEMSFHVEKKEGLFTNIWPLNLLFPPYYDPMCIVRTLTCPFDLLPGEVREYLTEAEVNKRIFKPLVEGVCRQVSRRVHPSSCSYEG